MKPLIKWTGGKSKELKIIKEYIPTFNRYIEPFFGGGALYFDLLPKQAKINDISTTLMNYYNLIKNQNIYLYKYLYGYRDSFLYLLKLCDKQYNDILVMYNSLEEQASIIYDIIKPLFEKDYVKEIILDNNDFLHNITKCVFDKMKRARKNSIKYNFNNNDLKNNLITGFMNGYYTYFRTIYNDIILKRIDKSIEYQIANFYFIKEFCYGSMCRFNNIGEFNVPYGGISYNNKDLKIKIDNMFNENIYNLFKETDLYNLDFEEFLHNIKLTDNDFIFLDPPYDTTFSSYDGKTFTKKDHIRLANILQTTIAKFMLVIKNTDFIYNLYKDNFNIIIFDNKYMCNFRTRNDRDVKHLIITNF